MMEGQYNAMENRGLSPNQSLEWSIRYLVFQNIGNRACIVNCDRIDCGLYISSLSGLSATDHMKVYQSKAWLSYPQENASTCSNSKWHKALKLHLISHIRGSPGESTEKAREVGSQWPGHGIKDHSDRQHQSSSDDVTALEQMLWSQRWAHSVRERSLEMLKQVTTTRDQSGNRN